MRYFLIETDKNYVYAPQIKNWFKQIDVRDLKKGSYDKIPKRLLLRLIENPNTLFTDVITTPFFLVSKIVKEVAEKFEPNLHFKEFVLLDQMYGKAVEYFLPTLDEIDCLTEESEFNLDHSILTKIVIDLDKVGDNSIFVLSGVKNRYVVVRLDFAESMLRRNAIGFCLKEIKCVRGKMVCQQTKNQKSIW